MKNAVCFSVIVLVLVSLAGGKAFAQIPSNGSAVTGRSSDARAAGVVLTLQPELVYQFCRSQCGSTATCDPNCTPHTPQCSCAMSVINTLANFTAFLLTSPNAQDLQVTSKIGIAPEADLKSTALSELVEALEAAPLPSPSIVPSTAPTSSPAPSSTPKYMATVMPSPSAPAPYPYPRPPKGGR